MTKDRSRNGGADEIPLPRGPGRLWLCGKHFIGPDPEEAMRRTGATTVVCLNHAPEIADRYPDYVDWLATNQPRRAIWFPVHDLHAPAVGAAIELVDNLRDRLDVGESLLVHCGAGIGRAGTIAAAVLISMGSTVDDAIATVAANRPMAGPEAGAQRDLLDALSSASG